MIITNENTLRDRLNPQLHPTKTSNSKNGKIVESNQRQKYVRNEETKEANQNTSDNFYSGSYKINMGNKNFRNNNRNK